MTNELDLRTITNEFIALNENRKRIFVFLKISYSSPEIRDIGPKLELQLYAKTLNKIWAMVSVNNYIRFKFYTSNLTGADPDCATDANASVRIF